MSEANKNLTIKDWALDDRPREKAMLKGLDALSDAELLAILIGNGTRNKTALDLAKEIQDVCNKDLNKLARMSIKELVKSVKGIGNAKAVSIAVALELGRRRNFYEAQNNKIYNSSNSLMELIKPLLQDKIVEEFYCILLNNALKLIGIERISIGGFTSTIVDVKVIFKQCIESGASSFAVAHNHPSGNTNPSNADNDITAKINEGAKILNLRLIDHIIITNNGYYSYMDNQKIT